MDSLKGTLISIAIFFLLVVPTMVDIMAMGIVTSQLNKVGAEMIQIVGSSNSYDAKTEKAIKLAKENYGVDVKFVSGTDYEFGDKVDLELNKEITRMLPMPGSETESGEDEYHKTSFTTKETILITKRDD